MVSSQIHVDQELCLVWISDYHDANPTMLFNQLKALKDIAVKLISMGSVSSSGFQSVDNWFRKRFKERFYRLLE